MFLVYGPGDLKKENQPIDDKIGKEKQGEQPLTKLALVMLMSCTSDAELL